MGVVYLARDRRDGRLVALKRMHRTGDSQALDRFKRELHTLQEIHHPNVVTLHEACGEGPDWFFTMDHIEGESLLAHVRGQASAADVPTEAFAQPAVVSANGAVGLPTSQLVRLRRALHQLAEALQAIHARGVVHRDVKPSNVLVTEQGRVVLLDFGLASVPLRDGPSLDNPGTLAYMAPEHWAGQAVPASDWYSVGVTLYQALTGVLPPRPVEAPGVRVEGVPEDLDRLCLALLHHDPGQRAGGREVLAACATEARDVALPVAPSEMELVGRAVHLSVLRSAYEESRQGRPVTVLVHGVSGVGKSALIQRFLVELRGEAVILAGRCYERDSVPYKALDGLVDALGRHWRRLPRTQAAELLPRNVGPLVQVFPVLRQVEAVRDAPAGGISEDAQQLRRQAFAALRDVLARLGDRSALVLALDDAQWGDADSAQALPLLLGPPEPPRLLFVASFRSEDRERSPFLDALGSVLPATNRELPVEPLGPEDAAALARSLLGEAQAARWADAVAHESGGSPFFVQRLAQAVRAGDSDVTLEGALRSAIAGLPTEQRSLLEVLAVAGRPLPLTVAASATGQPVGLREAVALQGGRLIRFGPGEPQQVEPYHDRIREAVVAGLSAETLRQTHGSLAAALEHVETDAEVLALHLDASGEAERARDHYAAAAARAAEALAFDRAARLYGRTLELTNDDDPRRPGWTEALAVVLANAGRGAEAGRLLEAIAGDSFEHRREAAEQYLRGGQLERGLSLLNEVLGAVGLSLPRTTRSAWLGIAWLRARLFFRGLRYTERDAAQVPEADLRRLDTCYSAALGFVLIDPIRTFLFQSRFLLLALQAGEPSRIALALATEMGFRAARGARRRPEVDALWQRAQHLAQRVGRPEVIGRVASIAAPAYLMLGDWQRCLDLAEEAIRLFQNRCVGIAWDLDRAYEYQLCALYMLGRWKEMAHAIPERVQNASQRGDLMALAAFRPFQALDLLTQDRPKEAEMMLEEWLRRWPASGYHRQHHNALVLRIEALLYQGTGRLPWEELQPIWTQAWKARLTYANYAQQLLFDLRGRCALAASSDPATAFGEREELLRVAGRCARSLESSGAGWGQPLAWLLRAGLEWRRGRLACAIEALAQAERGFEATAMTVRVALTRWRHGQLLGGDEGQRLVREAETVLLAQDVRKVAATVDRFIPAAGPSVRE